MRDFLLNALALFNAFKERFEKVWKHPITGWFLLVAFTVLAFYWKWHTPTVGKAIAVLAVVAAIMTTLKGIGGVLEFALVLLLFGFLFIEMRAIDQDKINATAELSAHFNKISVEAQTNMKNILDDENMNFQSVLKTQQDNFKITINELIHDERQQNDKFTAVLREQRDLFEHEEHLAESLNGMLVAGNDPTPDTDCPKGGSDSVLVFFGELENHVAALVNGFPHTVLAVGSVKAITLDRSPNGSIIVSMDIRSDDGRIIARLNKNGFVVNRNNFLEMKRDAHNLEITDDFGNEVLNARFLNPHAFQIKGILNYPGHRPAILNFPNMHYFCTAGVGGIDIAIE